MVLIRTVKPIQTDEEFSKHEGTWFNDTSSYEIFTKDVDIYSIEDDGSKRLLAKFRKRVLPNTIVQNGWDAFRNAAGPSRNRGAAAGPIDPNNKYWRKRKPVEIDKWSTKYVIDGKIKKMRVNNNVASGVVGFYEKTPFLGIPCRMTSYTRSNMKNFLHGLPFLQAIDQQFKQLVPDAYAKQRKAIEKKPLYQIEDTAFSTVTVNLNFRTALHKDAGDFKEGFGNLTVIEWGKYHGSFTLFPRFKIGFDVRTGDFLAMNVHEWHTNSPIVETEEDKKFNKQLPDIRTRDPNVGVAGSEHKYHRLTFVCYFREKLEECEEKKTEEYYKREGFDLRQAKEKARRNSMPNLPLPGLTGTMEQAHYAVDNTKAGSAARLAQTRKRTRNNRSKTERKDRI